MSKKKCRACGKKKSVEEYGRKGYTPGGAVRRRAVCNGCRRRIRRVQRFAGSVLAKQDMRQSLPKSDVYVITWAQSATPAHQDFVRTLKVLCEERGAELAVVPGRYRNPTSQWSAADAESDNWYDAAIEPYLLGNMARIGPFAVHAEISILPTAVTPLTGMQAFGTSCIFGHPKRQFETVPTAGELPRVFSTTGACTIENYTDSKAGAKGNIHHTLGAVILERDGKFWHLRHISANEDGTFHDLDRYYTPDGSRPADRAAALVLGDVHVAKTNWDVLRATLRGPDSIAGVLRPELVVYHDVFDMDARNHHNRKDFEDSYQRAHGMKNDCVRTEIDQTIAFVEDWTPDDSTAVIVESNHDAALDRWKNETDFRDDPKNARVFLDLWRAKLDAIDAGEPRVSSWELACRMWAKRPESIRFISERKPLRVHGIELGYHGDFGPKGARGSLAAFAKVATKMIIGHGHGPGWRDGVTQVGVSAELDQGYNRGPSDWLHTHCAVYADGKRALITVLGGSRWRQT